MNHLPQQFQSAHDYCFILHDFLASTVHEIEEKNLHNVNIHFESEDKQKSFYEMEDILETMKEFGFQKEYELLMLRQVAIATLSEFLHFIYEALSTSEKGKLSVTFTLLRKPFKEILLLWEWILIDPSSFIERFEKDSSGFDITKSGRWEHIKEQLGDKEVFDKASLDLIFEIRFAKNILYGFEKLWNKSIHLVTNDKHYTTESLGLNFVFSDLEDKNTQWEHLYFSLPILMVYAVYVFSYLSEHIFDKKLDSLEKALEFINENPTDELT